MLVVPVAVASGLSPHRHRCSHAPGDVVSSLGYRGPLQSPRRELGAVRPSSEECQANESRACVPPRASRTLEPLLRAPSPSRVHPSPRQREGVRGAATPVRSVLRPWFPSVAGGKKQNHSLVRGSWLSSVPFQQPAGFAKTAKWLLGRAERRIPTRAVLSGLRGAAFAGCSLWRCLCTHRNAPRKFFV